MPQVGLQLYARLPPLGEHFGEGAVFGDPFFLASTWAGKSDQAAAALSRLSFQRSQGQADAGNHPIPVTLFLLRVGKIKQQIAERTRDEKIAPTVKYYPTLLKGDARSQPLRDNSL
jgi:hypothetical protein